MAADIVLRGVTEGLGLIGGCVLRHKILNTWDGSECMQSVNATGVNVKVRKT